MVPKRHLRKGPLRESVRLFAIGGLEGKSTQEEAEWNAEQGLLYLLNH